MLLNSSASGVFPIAPTPFRPDGEIDTGSIDRLIKTYRNAGCAGTTVLGMMGEAQKLDASEAVEVAAQFIEGMNLPVVVGVSAPGFAAMRSLTRAVMSRGAAAVMIAPPPHLRTDDQIVGYFKQSVEAIGSDVPFVIQDYPLVLTVQMTPKVIRQIVEDNPSCVMLKHED
jgi:4-hydroxy-tetrahydrodipicolinate synthase